MKRRTLLAAAVIAACGFVPASAHHPHEVSKDYVGSWDPLSPRTCEQNEMVGMNVGGACFDIPHPTSQRATIEIADTVNPQPAFFYRFVDVAGNCADPAPGDLGCDSAGISCTSVTAAIPSNAVELEVLPSGAVLGPVACVALGQSSLGAATAGTITATFLT